MNTTAVVTIVSNNYLHFARTLMQSVAQHHPEADRFCVLVDRDLSHVKALSQEFFHLELGQLGLPEGDNFLFQYNVLELNTAVKPWALAHLLERGYQKVIYIDPDIVLYRPLVEVMALLAAGASLVLTPHLLAPVTDGLNPNELDIRRAGTYNLGFCALSHGPEARAMLSWWQGKLERHCVIAHDQGIFVDQSWVDLVPGLFDRVAVLRHPGYNVAYWNLAQRPVTAPESDEAEAGQLRVAGEPLTFFHYSGLNPLAPHPVSKYQNRFTLDSLAPTVAKLITDYCQRVADNGMAHYRSLDYGFGNFDDTTPITDAERSRFRTRDDLRSQAHGQPFACRQLLAIVRPAQLLQPLLDSSPAEKSLHRLYSHFLGRLPDDSGRRNYFENSQTTLGRWLAIYRIATSVEAKAKPGWRTRLLSWPLQHAQLSGSTSVDAALTQVVTVAPSPADRPAPYAGLHAPEPDSAQHGLWVGPRLDLPACAMHTGRIQIKGTVDLALLARAGVNTLALDLQGPHGLLHRAAITRSGPFAIDVTVPTNSLNGSSQWSVIASNHVIPQAIGMGEDTRALAWRVISISVDGITLVDCSRSPSTQAIAQLFPATGINLTGYLAAELGLGEAARSLASACTAVHIPFSAVDVGFQSQNLQRDTRVLASAVSKRFAIDLLYVNADQTAATAKYLQQQGLKSQYRIGYWHWEQPELPATALGAFAHVDEVWVPSTFVHDAVAPFSPVPVVKIPHAIDFSPSPGNTRTQFGLPCDKVLVLVMYDFHSYQYRKNPQAALAAFRQAAAHRQDVALVIKTINGEHHPEAREALRQSVNDMSHVIFIDAFFTRQQTWDLQACCDILLSLHRAEGFGLAPAEMMFLGKPVIATGWSANTDFMTVDNSMPVQYQLQPLAEAVGVYPAGQLWAEADIHHAAWCLTRLLDDPGLRQSLGARASADIRRQLNPQTVGALVQQRLSLLGFWYPQLRSAV
ncbi:MAG: glycosyltransferase [Gallionella sp.]|nr:glycosyltransferase [Gallionella sp.]